MNEKGNLNERIGQLALDRVTFIERQGTQIEGQADLQRGTGWKDGDLHRGTKYKDYGS